MNLDQFGRCFYTADDLCNLLYSNPTTNFDGLLVTDPEEFNHSVTRMHINYKKLEKFMPLTVTVEEFDRENQQQWLMPETYKSLDIAKWILNQCHSDAELQRAGRELLLFQEREMFDLLRFMKFFVDTMREHKIVWGVGRGSSVASFVLYLIGVHRINSLYYDLDETEFLK